MDYLAAIQIERIKLWNRVYGDAIHGYYMPHEGGEFASGMADQAVRDFDERFPKQEQSHE